MTDRLVALDVLRGLAVLSVLIGHAPVAETQLPMPLKLVLQFTARLISGLELFFVLSGFLVAGLLFREHRARGTVHLGRFLVRRAFKIYPAFYVFLCVSVAVSASSSVFPSVTLPQVVAEAAFAQSYVRGIWSHTWSLAVEEHFYLLLAGVFAWLCVRSSNPTFAEVPRFTAVVCGGCLIARIVTTIMVPEFDFWVHLAPTHLRLDSLACGVLLAYWHHYHRPVVTSWMAAHRTSFAVAAAVLLFSAAVVPKATAIGHTVLQVMQYIGHGAVILLAVYCPSLERLYCSTIGVALQWIGRYSYSTYLWHMPVLALSNAAVGGAYAPDLSAAMYGALCMPVGWVTAKAVEMPFLACRERYFPSALGGHRCD